jgi:hypothetical protein
MSRPVKDILARVRDRSLGIDAADAEIARSAMEGLGFANVDHDRARRQGFPEVIYCPGKTPAQVALVAQAIIRRGHPMLATRATREQFRAVKKRVPVAVYHGVARAIVARPARPAAEAPRASGLSGLVVTAGTADIPVAEEAALVMELSGHGAERVFDVGVAGIHRLLRHADRLREARVVVVVAGMEGALASVVGGLVRAPVIAVPTSVGYGSHLGGIAPLLAMLNSCAPNVAVVNIDNGFGAGFLASSILAQIARARGEAPSAPRIRRRR